MTANFPGSVVLECITKDKGGQHHRYVFVRNAQGEYVHTHNRDLKAGDVIMMYEPEGTYVKDSFGTVVEVEYLDFNYRLYIQPLPLP